MGGLKFKGRFYYSSIWTLVATILIGLLALYLTIRTLLEVKDLKNITSLQNIQPFKVEDAQ